MPNFGSWAGRLHTLLGALPTSKAIMEAKTFSSHQKQVPHV
jgi:hypothetical protein